MMRIKSMIAERSKLVKEFANRLGVKPEYQGAPSFAYQIGAYTILRDGSIEVNDSEADLEFLRRLQVEGLIDSTWEQEKEVIEISLSMDGHTGRSLVNLARIIACRGQLINKSVGCIGAFKVNERLLEKLDEGEPKTAEEFLAILEASGGNEMNRGIEFHQEVISFTGFPLTEDSDEVKAFMDLVALINKMALTQQRIHLERPDTSNEKYTFRVWLLRLGMTGDQYKVTRRILLRNLSGHSAFRTKEQMNIAKEKSKKNRKK